MIKMVIKNALVFLVGDYSSIQVSARLGDCLPLPLTLLEGTINKRVLVLF
jgi:hypothetical protein